MSKIRGLSANYDNKYQQITNDTDKKHSKQYSLIYEINQLKKPVFNLVQSIIKKSKQNENKPKRKISVASQRGSSYQRKKNSFSMNENYDNKVNSILNESTDTKDYRSRVCRIHSRKRELLSQQQNIDRLNARLDYYINDKIGTQKVNELKKLF